MTSIPSFVKLLAGHFDTLGVVGAPGATGISS